MEMIVTPRLFRVILSRAGVGQFDFCAQVSAHTDVAFFVPAEQANDILASLTISDPAGQVLGVSMARERPVVDAFRSLPMDPWDFDSLKDLFQRLRGAEVRIAGQAPAAGRIVGAETTPSDAQAGTGPREVREAPSSIHLYLMTANGLKRVALDNAASIEFVDIELKAAIDAGLAALNTYYPGDLRELKVSMKGNVERTIHLSFVAKTQFEAINYQLSLTGEDAWLRGWAIVENPTHADWSDIELVLISGDPVASALTQSEVDALLAAIEEPESGFADLERSDPPTIEPPKPEFADLEQLDSHSIQLILREVESDKLMVALSGGPDLMSDLVFSNMSERAASMIRADIAALGSVRQADINTAQDYIMDVARRLADEGEIVLPAPRPRPQPNIGTRLERTGPAPVTFDAKLEPAEAGEAGSQFSLKLPYQVRVPAGRTVALPFVDMQVPVRRYVLYEPSLHPVHPVTALSIMNASSISLPNGGLTLYESNRELGFSTFGGSVVMPELPADEARLVTFSTDPTIAVNRERHFEEVVRHAEIATCRLRRHIVERETTFYRLRVASTESRLLLIDHPRRDGWRMAEPPVAELMALHHRIEVELAPGEHRDIAVTLERGRTMETDISTLSEGEYSELARDGKLGQAQREFFSNLAALAEEKRNHMDRVWGIKKEEQEIQFELEQYSDDLSTSSSWFGRRRYRDKDTAQKKQVIKLGKGRRELERRVHEIEMLLANQIAAGAVE
jgi:hypothetical protein